MDPYNLSTHSFVSKLITIDRLDRREGGGYWVNKPTPNFSKPNFKILNCVEVG